MISASTEDVVKLWQKAIISMLVTCVLGGLYLAHVWNQRRDPGVIARDQQNTKSNMDDFVIMRSMSPHYFENLKRIEGLTVWMKNGYVMPYFPATGGHIQFSKPAGKIPSAQKLEIKKFVKSSVPADLDTGMSHPAHQAFALFTMPPDAQQYAVAVGDIEGQEEAYFCDLEFFYDDPHTIYDHWSKDVWTAIDARQVKPGMSERQTHMAIGLNANYSSHEKGNRTVTYDQAGKKWVVTYVNDKATVIKAP
jgi:hypothetical protein